MIWRRMARLTRSLCSRSGGALTGSLPLRDGLLYSASSPTERATGCSATGEDGSTDSADQGGGDMKRTNGPPQPIP